MENGKKRISLYDIVAIGLMAAFVFIATFFFKIKIPTPGGSTMVKLGNGICLLCGTLLGGWRGGLAAGFGCALFDLTDPEYAPTAYITFIRYFIMARSVRPDRALARRGRPPHRAQPSPRASPARLPILPCISARRLWA